MRRLATSTAVMALALLAGAYSAPAQSGDEAAIAQAVEGFRKAMLGADRGQFEALCADELSYGHSSGKRETKAQVIAAVVSGKSTWKFITPDGSDQPDRRTERHRAPYSDRRDAE